MRFEFLSSTPASPTEGSGTWVALDGLARGLVALGHSVDFRPLRTRTGIHTFDRWLYNRQVAAKPPTADVVVGVDLDGYRWAAQSAAHRGAWGPSRGPHVQTSDQADSRQTNAARPDRRDATPDDHAAGGAARGAWGPSRGPHVQTSRQSDSPQTDAGRARYVVALKGIIADELRNERGLVRALLGVQARWERANVALAERVVVPSRYSASIAEALYGVEASRVVVVPEPIDLAEWRRRFDAVPRVARARPTVLCVARLYPRKRVADLLHAAVHLSARIPDAQVRIVGEGPESARLRRLHRDLALGNAVTFLGDISRQALAVEYMSAECFCLPTVQEGFGIVFTEAMAAGLPVVACRAAAVPEVVEDRRTGLLVNPRAPEELAMAMETLLRNPGLRAEMGEAGRRRAELFGLEPVATRFLTAVGG